MSFGTEGRKEGLQIPCSDKVYDFVKFCRSDIQDLEILPPLPIPNVPTSQNDPGIIIQSQHTLEAPTVPTTMPSDRSHSVTYPMVSMDDVQSTMRPTYQSALPRTCESLGIPMNWPVLDAHYIQPPKPSFPILQIAPASSSTSSMPTESPLNSLRLVSSVSLRESGLPTLVHDNAASLSLDMNTASSSLDVNVASSLATPQMFLSRVLPTPSKMAEPNLAESLWSVVPLTQDPLLLVPKESFQETHHNQGNGTVIRPNYLRRGRGRGTRALHTGRWQVVPKAKQFTEDFDFDTMNERFKMVAVHSDLNEEALDGEDNAEGGASKGDDTWDELSKLDPSIKPCYVKDDFFDSLPCETSGQTIQTESVKSSEQRNINEETFGSSSLRFRGRHRGYGYRGARRGGYSYYGARRGRGYSYGYNRGSYS